MLTFITIVGGAIGLIAIQPALTRAFPRLQPTKRDPWVDFWSPNAIETRWLAVEPKAETAKREGAIVRWWNKPSALETYNTALKTYTGATDKLLKQSTTLLERIKAEQLPAPNPDAPPSEIYIDGTTGKRIVPEGLDKFTREQQLADMNRQIAQHDQHMSMLRGQMEQEVQNNYAARRL
jgi:hypothetical protein